MNSDKIFLALLILISLFFISTIFLLAFELFVGSYNVLASQGLYFITGSEWDPVHGIFGIFPAIVGSFMTSLIALTLATPISLLTAYFIAELSPTRFKPFVSSLVELLAAIPSVIYGLWALLTLAPFLRENVYIPLQNTFYFIPFFQGPVTGVGVLTASIVLAVMLLPTMTSIIKEAIELLPVSIKEAAIAVGALRYEVAKIIFTHIRLAIIAALLLAFARAYGEAMAVAMVIGARHSVPSNIFSAGYTMPSLIVHEFLEAVSDLHYQALIAIGFVLFLIALANIVVARIIIARTVRFLKGAYL